MKVTYIDHMGTDLSVVNAARVSFGKRSQWDVTDVLSEADRGLIGFLARGCTSGDWKNFLRDTAEEQYYQDVEPILNHIRKMPPHWSPFAHTAVTLHLKMPIFVARQIMKHTTGIVYNEVSRRYVDSEPEFYVPDVWRKRADNVKQGSSDEEMTHITWIQDGLTDMIEVGGTASQVVQDHYNSSRHLYEAMLNCGCSPEQARMVLPQSMYTEVIATGNIFAWANMYNQRTDSHAQKETQEIAKQLGEIIEPLYPVSWKELTQ